MKKTHWFMVVGILVLVVAGFFMFSSKQATGAVVKDQGSVNAGEVQKITLSMKDYNYYPTTITVKANSPVELYLDKSVVGCLRAFTIPDLGVQKYVKSDSDAIKFTPTKAGTYRFACTMNMAYGTLIVEE